MRCSQAFIRALLTAAIAGFVLAEPPPAMAAVYPRQQALSTQTIKEFLANPGALLTQYPNGGPDMIKRVRDLAASDPATLNALLGLLANANSDQATAIGTALGDVAKMAATSDPNFAAQIQVAVVVANNDPALAAFKAVVGGDIQLTAVAGGVGGGGGGGGGPTTPIGAGNGSGGSNSPSLITVTPTASETFTFPGLGSSGPGSGSVSR